jgi:hypothetical protein
VLCLPDGTPLTRDRVSKASQRVAGLPEEAIRLLEGPAKAGHDRSNENRRSNETIEERGKLWKYFGPAIGEIGKYMTASGTTMRPVVG